MEIKQLQTFQALTQELNFTKTAKILNYAQSSVSAQIHALESEFGTPLFERISVRVRRSSSRNQGAFIGRCLSEVWQRQELQAALAVSTIRIFRLR